MTEVLLSSNDENGFSVGSAPRPCNEDPRPSEIELRESLETAVEGDRTNGKKGIRV
jgi:hypothetical protein